MAMRSSIQIRSLLLICLLAGKSWAADPLDTPTEEAAPAAWSLFGDVLLRSDQVHNLPARDPVDRLRARTHLGLRFTNETVEFAVAVAGNQGDDSNRDNRRNNDNSASDSFDLDQAFVRWQVSPETSLLLGKSELPLSLTPAVWDADLRPIGASVGWSHPLSDFDRVSAVGGYFAGDHLYGDDTRFAAAQLGWHHGEGGPGALELLLGWIDFQHTRDLFSEGLSRTNRRVGSELLSDYRLLDGQIGWRHNDARWPIDLRLDLVRNLGADDANDGVRGSVVVGDRRQAGGMEFGLAMQRLQRDSVLAAFNEDDWWFHSFSRGTMPWFGYGFSEHWNLRIAGFFERRDDQQPTIVRALVDVRGQW